jgi:primosomal protein N' (replication factor Y)
MKDDRLFVRVAVDRYVDKLFDYSVPEALRGHIGPGSRVVVDFRGKTISAVVVQLADTPEVPVEKVKPVISADEAALALDDSSLALARWISDYYCAPLGMVLKCMVPAQVRKGKKKRASAAKKDADAPLDTYLPPVPHVLNDAQKQALEQICGTLSKGEFATYLLHGVTGSGKTEVYLRAIDHAKKLGRQSIVIVPEIALTPQMIEMFRARFDDVALYHSQLTPAQRRDFWMGMKQGRTSIVIGARSAVFAPFAKPGLIIVDEEHEHTYKQGETPLYNARDVAVMRGKISNACVVLGSATPSLESYRNAKKGKYALLSLPSRVDSKELPEVRVVDMRQELRKTGGKNPIFSSALLDAVTARLAAGEQAILFLNRRGYSTFIYCKECGWAARCGNCSITLTYHREDATLRCHRCGFSGASPKGCPECGSADLRDAGTGTEKVERQLAKIFPEAKVGRMDTDVTKKKSSYEDILGSFRRGKIDILVGTQMIAKGLDIPNVTLVGIIAADMALNLPDFRSAEHTFQLITQVAGRAGRGAVKGEVILQTFSPDLPLVRLAATQDYPGFYEMESVFRCQLRYPPEVRFINLLFRSRDDAALARAAHGFAAELRARLSGKNVFFKGPAPSPIKRIEQFYRWNLVIGTPSIMAVTEVLKGMELSGAGGVQVVCDVDPLSQM